MQGPAQCHHMSGSVEEGCLIIAHGDGFRYTIRSKSRQSFSFQSHIVISGTSLHFPGYKTHPRLESHVVIVSPTLPELLVGLGALVLQAEH